MYQLDMNAAKESEQFSSRIAEIGKYVGKFIQAYHIESSKGSKGITLDFESNDKQSAEFTLYTFNKDGEPIFGYKQLMALMTCLKVKNLSPVDGKFTAYDNAAGERLTKEGQVFNELIGKQIGLLIETEEYENGKGEVKTKPVIKAFFQADSELMATEILDRKTKPEQLEKVVAALRHRPLKGSNPAKQQQSVTSIEDLDSDIPF